MPRIQDIDRFVFIVGAPRCGTTTHRAFAQGHPDVVLPVRQGAAFLRPARPARTDDRRNSFGRSKAAISSISSRTAGSGDAIGVDGSVSYLYAPEQLEPVLKLWPDSRFVVALRDPIDFASVASQAPDLHSATSTSGGSRTPGRRSPAGRRASASRGARRSALAALRRGGALWHLCRAAVRHRRAGALPDPGVRRSGRRSAAQYRRLMDFSGSRRWRERWISRRGARSHDVRSACSSSCSSARPNRCAISRRAALPQPRAQARRRTLRQRRRGCGLRLPQAPPRVEPDSSDESGRSRLWVQSEIRAQLPTR